MEGLTDKQEFDIDALFASIRNETTSHLASMETRFTSTFEKGLTQFKNMADLQFTRIERDLHHINERQTAVETSMASHKRQIEKICEQLAIAEKIIQPTVRDISFDREVSPVLVRLSCMEALAKAAVLEGSIGTLLAEAGLDPTNYAIEGEQLGKFYSLRFLGEPNLAGRRLNKFMDMLRGPAGDWRELGASTPTGKHVKIYVNRDRNPRQVKEETLGKRLQKAVLQQLERKGTPMHTYFKKRDNTLFVNWEPVAKLIVEGPEVFTVRWNLSAADPLQLDRDAIVASLDNARESANPVQWSG